MQRNAASGLFTKPSYLSERTTKMGNKLGLNLKFSLIIGLILFLFCSFFSILLYHYLKAQVVRDAEEKTMIIMTMVKSIGSYVRETLRPKVIDVLAKLERDQFIIEAMSTTHVSMQVMARFNKDIKAYVYKRVSDNPMNPNNRADFFHLDMITYFRLNQDIKSWDGVVDIDDKMYIARLRPIVMETSCLQCHGNPSDAPKEIIEKYGTGSGFGRRVGTVVGVDYVSVPMDIAFTQVKAIAFYVFILGIFALCFLFLALYATFRNIVSKPLDKLSGIFKGIAGGTEPLGRQIQNNRQDEIGDLTVSFNTLSQYLLDAQGQLKKVAEIEKQMIKTEKLAVLGQLSAGVAHEINNPLGGIKLCFDNVVSTQMDEETRKAHIDVINAGFDRIQGIIRHLLDFSKQSSLSVMLVSINNLIDYVLHLIDYQITKKNIMVIKNFSPDIPDIVVDPNKIEQVFLNIMLNAVQAIDEDKNGVLAVTTSCSNGFCEAFFKDTGSGICDEVLPRIFDPFFTTKPVGEGTGLGLSVSKSIIEQHGGRIDVETSDSGTVFIIRLPLVK